MEFELEKRLKNFLSDVMNASEKSAEKNASEKNVDKTLGGNDTKESSKDSQTGSFKDALNDSENVTEGDVDTTLVDTTLVDTTQKAIDMGDLFESINVMDVEKNKIEGGVDMSTMMGEISVEQKQLTDVPKKAFKGKMEGFANGDIEGGGNNDSEEGENDPSEEDGNDPSLELSDYSDGYNDIDDVYDSQSE